MYFDMYFLGMPYRDIHVAFYKKKISPYNPVSPAVELLEKQTARPTVLSLLQLIQIPDRLRAVMHPQLLIQIGDVPF